eukprot:TRINITY_DN2963_c0_g1_i2.p1 TRINITY_DN2963_c0_g1~~TRINITY_DN2963_c0_g1_i2.p1  ORF type:complete len:233 (+),score=20.02 TRINITY_DN2963_c0_g1_i2:31-729(+)
MDQYQLRTLTQNDIIEVAELYADVWEHQNYFMKAMGITKQDFYQVSLSITQLCASYPLSNIIVDKESGIIIGYALCAPYRDSISLITNYELIENPRMKMWMHFNDTIIRLVRPYLRMVNVDKLLYGFAIGVHRDYVGKGIYNMVHHSSMGLHRQYEYLYTIGNAEHFAMIRKAEESPHCYVLIRYDWRNWVYQGMKPLKHIEVPYITCSITCLSFETYEHLDHLFQTIEPKL